MCPKPSQRNTRRRKPDMNSQTVCITEESILEQLRAEEEENLKAAEKKQKLESQWKKKERNVEKARKAQEKAIKAAE